MTLRPVRYLQRTSDESSEGVALREGAVGGSEIKVQAAERVGGAGPGEMGKGLWSRRTASVDCMNECAVD